VVPSLYEVGFVAASNMGRLSNQDPLASVGEQNPDVESVAIIRAGDGTLKYRFPCEFGLNAEAAYFSVPGRDLPHIACVSTQLGCAAHCRFCSTVKTGFIRNLQPEEILRQVATIFDDAVTRGVSIDTCEVSFMGMGEPLANQNNVLTALGTLHHRYPELKRVALSTIGPAFRIMRLADAAADHPVSIHLQISLHATSQTVRRKLIPNAPDTIEELLEAGCYYHRQTGDRVCLNYILLDGINDSPQDAAWFDRVDRNAFFIKLTVLNAIPGLASDLRASPPHVFAEFASRLAQLNVVHRVFHGDGLDIQASCGQLAARPVPLQFYGASAEHLS
jgi:23S rRNA (adenine2503-C2)-methyltransferase